MTDLPGILTPASAEEILSLLAHASRRGRLAGFAPRPGGGGLFEAAAHGHPFDSVLIAAHRPGTGLSFRVVMRRRAPLVFAAILAATVWPGVYCTDELVAQLLPSLWGPWITYYWYLPLTILPIPWIWSSTMRRSRATARGHALETIRNIAAELGATVAPSPGA